MSNVPPSRTSAKLSSTLNSTWKHESPRPALAKMPQSGVSLLSKIVLVIGGISMSTRKSATKKTSQAQKAPRKLTTVMVRRCMDLDMGTERSITHTSARRIGPNTVKKPKVAMRRKSGPPDAPVTTVRLHSEYSWPHSMPRMRLAMLGRLPGTTRSIEGAKIPSRTIRNATQAAQTRATYCFNDHTLRDTRRIKVTDPGESRRMIEPVAGRRPFVGSPWSLSSPSISLEMSE
mmetsp:Transcript_13941/g.44657  ORF Transcript_13941/g.44657 Transcript_13941/m.44657 type:complete len:232 (-) Transcript_13941:708-1403(-)